MSEQLREAAQAMTDERICELMDWNVEAMLAGIPSDLTTRVRALVRAAEAEAVAADRACRLPEMPALTDEQIDEIEARVFAENTGTGRVGYSRRLARAVEALCRGKV